MLLANLLAWRGRYKPLYNCNEYAVDFADSRVPGQKRQNLIF